MVPQATMIVGNQIEGRNFFNAILDGTSNAAYVKKKTVKQRLYSVSVRCRSSYMPWIFALPMLEGMVQQVFRDRKWMLETLTSLDRGTKEGTTASRPARFGDRSFG